jgi:cell division transport system ATP-binding protein
VLLREIAPNSGRILINGKDITNLKHKQVAAYRRKIGCVFQDFRLLKDRNVYENVAFAQKVIGVPHKLIGQNVRRILTLVGLGDKEQVLPKQLSGGEQQRVALARALVNKPAMLLADEPTGNLDPKTSMEIMQLLEAINQQGTTVIVVTHDNEIVNQMRKRVITLKEGEVYQDEEDGSYAKSLSIQNESLFSGLARL